MGREICPTAIQRLDSEIRRHTDTARIFPDGEFIIRLVGAVLVEQHHDWAEGRRYLGLDVLGRAQAVDTCETRVFGMPRFSTVRNR